MGIKNNLSNVHITRIHNDSHVNLGTTVNQNKGVISKVCGSASTIGESGVNLNFEKNLYIKLKLRS